jgi:hypothetical protein
MNIAVIGTAGRNQDGIKIGKKKYVIALALLKKQFDDLKECTLVSGGAAVADHCAVVTYLFKGCAGLILHLPCEWDRERKQFFDTGERDWRTNPGGTSNKYHRDFSRILGVPENYSLNQIDQTIDKGAVINCGGGFFERNSEVAKDADRLFAMTFGKEGRVADGGTRDTFEKYIKLGKKDAFHLDLNTMQVYTAV